MSYVSEEELKSFLGKDLKDTYGRKIGKIIGLGIDDFGELKTLHVEHGSGNLGQYLCEHIVINKGEVVLIPDWKVSSELIQKELDRVTRRIQALGDLLKDRQIPANIYEELRRKQGTTLEELNRRKQDLIEGLKKRSGQVDRQVDDLIRFLVSVKMEYKAGIVDDRALTVACDAIEPNLKPLIEERKDLSRAMEKIEKPAEATGQKSVAQTPLKTDEPIALQLEG
ncbi:CdvA-like protein [Candidatus Bathyarchaeota archaeon]|nr:CdvA-like protein [Candidatus Bathyarchaeota archaeon]